MTRRDLIRSSARWLGASMTVAQFGALSQAVAATGENDAPHFLEPRQFALLAAIAEVLVPETDTPGAGEAGVPVFIDRLLAEWATPERQQRYVAGLEKFDELARTRATKAFTDLAVEQQLALLQALDDEAYSDGGDQPFYLELKKMILFAYYTSEAGATEELRFARIPGNYEPCRSLEDDARAWFWNGYSYGL